MAQSSGLTVRQHERRAIELQVELVIADEHCPQVSFSPASSAVGRSLIRGIATDLSPGGMGLSIRQFLPKMCEGQVRVFGTTPSHTAADGTPIYEVIFEHRVKVRRIYMTSHEPTYGVGVSFVDPEPDLDARVSEVLTMVAAHDVQRRPAPPEPEHDAHA